MSKAIKNCRQLTESDLNLASRNRVAHAGLAGVCFGLLLAVILAGKSSFLLTVGMCFLVSSCPLLVTYAFVLDWELVEGKRTIISKSLTELLSITGVLSGLTGIVTTLWYFSATVGAMFIAVGIASVLLGTRAIRSIKDAARESGRTSQST
jgi:hypothetical protein